MWSSLFSYFEFEVAKKGGNGTIIVFSNSDFEAAKRGNVIIIIFTYFDFEAARKIGEMWHIILSHFDFDFAKREETCLFSSKVIFIMSLKENGKRDYY